MSTETETVYYRHEEPSGKGGTVYRYTRREFRADGGFSHHEATEREWVTAELERLADVRDDSEEPSCEDFLAALHLAEHLMGLADDLEGFLS